MFSKASSFVYRATAQKFRDVNRVNVQHQANRPLSKSLSEKARSSVPHATNSDSQYVTDIRESRNKGFIRMYDPQVNPEEPLAILKFTRTSKRSANINKLWVAQDMRRKGCGDLVMKEGLSYLKNCNLEEVELYAYPLEEDTIKREDLIRIYERHGFQFNSAGFGTLDLSKFS